MCLESPFLRKIYAGMKITKESFKTFFMNKSYAVLDSLGLGEHGVQRPNVGDLTQLNINLRDFSFIYFYRHCQEASYSKNITVTRIRVSAVNQELKPANYNQYSQNNAPIYNVCESKRKTKCELVFGKDYKEISETCNNNNQGATGTCYNYELVDSDNSTGELIFHIEYVRRLDPDGVVRTFKEIVQSRDGASCK